MNHIYIPGKKNQGTFILLHGTGGTEHDLLDVAKELNENYNVLSIRGAVQENGMNRYFKRLAEGLYDEQDLAIRGTELLTFIEEMSQTHDFDLADAVFVGFSNGANIAINLLLKDQAPYKKAILFHPMYPVTVTYKNDLAQLNVFVTAGTQDPIASVADSNQVVNLLTERGANVETFWTKGHQLTLPEVMKAHEWLNSK